MHAVVVCISKIKSGGRFDGELTDGFTLMQMVGFDQRQQENLEK